jgi:hypothetical protein
MIFEDTGIAIDKANNLASELCIVRSELRIEIEVWHWNPLPNFQLYGSSLSPLGSPITTLLFTADCGRVLRFSNRDR